MTPSLGVDSITCLSVAGYSGPRMVFPSYLNKEKVIMQQFRPLFLKHLTLHVVWIERWISRYRSKHGRDLKTMLFTGSVPACVISVDNRRSFVLWLFVFALHQKYLQRNYKNKIQLCQALRVRTTVLFLVGQKTTWHFSGPSFKLFRRIKRVFFRPEKLNVYNCALKFPQKSDATLPLILLMTSPF